jgi:hypothetical protein
MRVYRPSRPILCRRPHHLGQHLGAGARCAVPTCSTQLTALVKPRSYCCCHAGSNPSILHVRSYVIRVSVCCCVVCLSPAAQVVQAVAAALPTLAAEGQWVPLRRATHFLLWLTHHAPGSASMFIAAKGTVRIQGKLCRVISAKGGYCSHPRSAGCSPPPLSGCWTVRRAGQACAGLSCVRISQHVTGSKGDCGHYHKNTAGGTLRGLVLVEGHSLAPLGATKVASSRHQLVDKLVQQVRYPSMGVQDSICQLCGSAS